MPKCRILQISQYLGYGGLERIVATLCQNVDPDRFEMEVLCLRDDGPIADELRAAGFTVSRLHGGVRDQADYLSALHTARFVSKGRFDVIHTHNTHAFIDGTLAALINRVPTLVHTDHARPFPDKRRYMLAERVLARRAYRVVGVSDHTTANLRSFEKIAEGKLVTIPNGIDFTAPSDTVTGADVRSELGIPSHHTLIGICSRLTEQKGFTYLLDAFQLVQRAAPDVTLIIAGEGPDEVLVERRRRELALADHVRLLGPRGDVPRLLRAFDVFVLPSIWEGLPMVILEAMASRCAIVASAVGGVPDAIEDGVTGSLVPPRDPRALAAALLRLIADPQARSRLGAAAFQRYQERYTADAMTRAYESLYLRGADAFPDRGHTLTHHRDTSAGGPIISPSCEVRELHS